MAKMRVYEYAKAINVSSKDIIAALKDMNIEVNNHMAMIEENAIKQLDQKFKKSAKPAGNKKDAGTDGQKPQQEAAKQNAGSKPNKNRDGKKNNVQNTQFNNKNKKKNNNNNNKKNKRGKNHQSPQEKQFKPKKNCLKKSNLPTQCRSGSLPKSSEKNRQKSLKN